MQLEQLKTILNNRLRTLKDLYVSARESGDLEGFVKLEVEITETEHTLNQIGGS